MKNGRYKDNKRVRLFELQQGLCYWCDKPMNLRLRNRRQPYNHPDDATFEHICPKKWGGGNTRDNIVLAHQFCNQLHDAMTKRVGAFRRLEAMGRHA